MLDLQQIGLAQPPDTHFYVYVYFDRYRVPFYVGKGQGARWRSRGSRNSEVSAMMQGPWSHVAFLGFDDEKLAYDQEIELISMFGRKDISAGPLMNRTAGGDGLRGVNLSAKAREKLRRLLNKAREDERFEQRRLRRAAAAQSDPLVNEKRSHSLKRYYSDPDILAKHTADISRRWDETYDREKHRASIAKTWQNPKTRSLRIKNQKLALSKAESRSRRSETARAWASKEENRTRVSHEATERWSDQDFKALVSDRCREAWADPQKRLKALIGTHRNWEKRHTKAGRFLSAEASAAKAEELEASLACC